MILEFLRRILSSYLYCVNELYGESNDNWKIYDPTGSFLINENEEDEE